ncbi:MAG: hypothetical protein HUJ72_00250 [Blautia sp.]|nr:hypothetical protein [Blautia sp.]
MLKLLLLFIPILFLLMTLLNLRNSGNGHLTGRQKIKLFLVIILVTALSFALACGINYLTAGDSASASITLNYAEATSGLNPDNSRFNPSFVTSDEVLETAISRAGLPNVTAQDLKNSLSVQSTLGGMYYSAKEDYRIATQYYLVFQKTDETKHLDPVTVVNTVAEVYNEKFIGKYSDNYSVLTVDASALASLDYLDAVEHLDKEAERLYQYMLSCNSSNWGFVSSTGESFETIGKKISNFQDVQLEKLNSYILTNGLSRNANQYISRLEYENRLLNVNYQKNVSSYNIRLDTIDMYDEELARIVLVPTEDQSGEFYMSQTQIGVDYFADEADQYMGEFADIQLRSDTNQYKINCLSGETGDPQGYQVVEKLIAVLAKDLKALSAQACAIAQEFSQKKASTFITIEKGEITLMDRLNIRMALFYAVGCAVLVMLWGLSLGRNVKAEPAARKTKARRFKEVEEEEEEEEDEE